MIDWEDTAVRLSKSKEQVKTLDKVTVICETCLQPRLIVYNAAKQRTDHPCMSCVKRKGQHKIGDPVTYTCACGRSETLGYRPHRQGAWVCRSCQIRDRHAAGVYTQQLGRLHSREMSPEQRLRIGQAAAARWLDDDYRQKWSQSRAATLIERSERSRAIWSDRERLDRLSESIRSMWATPSYRELRTQQSQQLWQQQEYRESHASGMSKAEVREKIARSSRDRWEDPEYRAEMARIRSLQPSTSSIQLLLYKYLDDLGVSYEREAVIGYYAFDCLIPGGDGRKNLLVECQGDYWHTLPGADSRDRSKFSYLNRYFPEYEIMYVWEHEFSAAGRVLDRLKQKLGVDLCPVDFNFRDVRLETPTSDELRSFLDSYHYIGKDRGGLCFGAYLGRELIGCAVYSSPLRQNTAGQFGLNDGELRELSRFCIHPAYHKRNFASWLIAQTLNRLSTSVVAYADSTVGHSGTIYRATGFQLHHVVPPDYWYVDGDGFVMHKRTLYGRSCKMGLTEREFACIHGYRKCWGGPKSCYVRHAK